MIAVGLVIVGFWVYSARGRGLPRMLLEVRPSALALLLSVLLLWHGLRFLRWQFMLRRAGIRVPIRPSLAVYLAGLAGVVTPAYVGEALRAVFLRRRFGTPVGRVLQVWVLERVLDFAALGILLLAVVVPIWIESGTVAIAALVALAGTVLLVVALRPSRRAAGHGAPGLSSAVPAATLLSLLMWAPATLTFLLAALGLGIPLGIAEGVQAYASSTILGGLTLMPAGIGTTGSFAILQLQDVGLELAAAVLVVSVGRATTTWLSVAVGGVFLVREFATARKAESAAHFDEIAAEYSLQFKDHVWSYLIGRKMNLLEDALRPSARHGIGLDLGCGLGLQITEMEERGFSVVGVDAAHNLLREATSRGAATAAADALRLPFPDASLDFVYTVGVLHHLPGWDAQARAVEEVARVLKPGGRFVVHETNPRNPLFRFYMGYVFPLLRSIDEGIEWWIEPRTWAEVPSFTVRKIEYFTFLPDFIPRRLMPLATRLERKLEHSRFRSLSVHYMAVLELSGPDR